ncbi:MAG: polyphosphate polymerase domain-containing protein [Lachnospiraceae bacterium]|nr:polyphosphate polymerase domain-containing protein [Lachnospiraceae bacterium]
MSPRGFRHELKYLITFSEMELLRRRLSTILKPDPHAENGTYLVRSLYFDDLFGGAYEEKLAGVSDRQKFRLRTYNGKDAPVLLECKHKKENYIRKESAVLTREEAERLISGDCTFLLKRKEPVCKETALAVLMSGLRPVVLVDYDRLPLIMEAGTVRVTFDMDVRAGYSGLELFGEKGGGPFFRVLEEGSLILEVKFTEFLPQIITDLLGACGACQIAASKFVLCENVRRAHQGLEVLT